MAKVTQKEKIIRATMMAQRVKNLASRLKEDAESYDVKFPIGIARELESAADDFLKLK